MSDWSPSGYHTYGDGSTHAVFRDGTLLHRNCFLCSTSTLVVEDVVEQKLHELWGQKTEEDMSKEDMSE